MLNQQVENLFVISFKPKKFVPRKFPILDQHMYFTKYRIAGKFGKFGKLSVIHQTKTIQINSYNYNLMALSIHSPNFSLPNIQKVQFTKFSLHQTFQLYGIIYLIAAACNLLIYMQYSKKAN